SVEWEDNGMDREFGARESLEFVRRINFAPSDVAFDKDMKT
ncbi:MAG: sugar phosphate isomerase/epimerase, partial [Acidobacteria bacterium]|nr:sugar phosphate isomerase/epimerase [Acidobacteriota bacterium]